MDVARSPGRSTDELSEVHTPAYVEATLAGRNDEWQRRPARPRRRRRAHVRRAPCSSCTPSTPAGCAVGFSPQGAKHHAMADRGSGFCVFNDMAWAARHFAARGRRVLYVDLDAHHGDGVEALTRDVPGS